MSTSVIGIRPPDEKWKKMKAIWDACESAGVDAPEEVCDFFNGEDPDPKGVLVELDECTSEYEGDASSGIEVNVDDLPPGIKIIRFYNSW